MGGQRIKAGLHVGDDALDPRLDVVKGRQRHLDQAAQPRFDLSQQRRGLLNQRTDRTLDRRLHFVHGVEDGVFVAGDGRRDLADRALDLADDAQRPR